MEGTEDTDTASLTDGGVNSSDAAEPGDILMWACNKAKGTFVIYEDGKQVHSRTLEMRDKGDGTYWQWLYYYGSSTPVGYHLVEGNTYYCTFDGIKSNTGVASAEAAANTASTSSTVKTAA